MLRALLRNRKPEAHLASYTMGTRSFPVVKRLGCGVDHPPPSSALWDFMACSRVNFNFYLLHGRCIVSATHKVVKKIHSKRSTQQIKMKPSGLMGFRPPVVTTQVASTVEFNTLEA
jgi:hypothetical protein